MIKLKHLSFLLVFLIFITSCSFIDNLKEKLGGSKTETEDTTKEVTAESNSENDIQFYNKYIDVLNKISEAVERFHKAYLDDVPAPGTIDKNSMIFVISSDVYLTMLERLHLDYKRSLFDNGELAKLIADNGEMKTEIEANLKDVLNALEEYNNTAREVVDYYKNKGYEKDAALSKSYDEKMTSGYNKYKDAFDKLNESVKKYKPERTKRDPDKISDPDEKAAVVLINAYENTLDGAEEFYAKLQKVEKTSDVSDLYKTLDEFEKKYNEDKNKVQSTEFTEKTKFMKYNFEDYFNKTVTDFVKETRKFLDSVAGKKMKDDEFNRGYDNVINYYNYMINSYNSSIGVLNTFQFY
jgi:vacuolar-type H+-ATPase subunit E/Vma4